MGQIISLDQNMVNMIAAGEVIERPANVVKELMENSIDAAAAKIKVAVEDGGRKLISVTDDGCGMDADDLGRAFDSHATSKIKSPADLRSISTLGFRGEALASIASVAQVEAVSRPRSSLAANCIEIDCGSKGPVKPCSADFGTTIHVRNIFYKLPARRKFLKTANTEMGHVIEHFTRMALANSDLDLTLAHNGRELYRVSAKDSLRRRIELLFSSEISEGLMETESTEKKLHVFALLGRPGISRASNKLQYIFLNKRFIRDKFISHAIKEAYRGRLEPNRFPVTFVFVDMPADEYDVNVHPTKIEVRFYNANLVHSQILGCLREKLLGTNLDAEVKMPPVSSPEAKQGTPPQSPQRSTEVAEALAEFFERHRPVSTQQQLHFPKASSLKLSVSRSGKPVDTTDTATAPPALNSYVNQIADDRSAPTVQREFLQIADSFIVTQADDGFIVIDQHALHERIIYESLQKRLSSGRLESQRLLIPECFRLTDAQTQALDDNCALIDKLGIELAPFGSRNVAIQAFPALLAKADPIGFVQDLLDLLIEKQPQTDEEKLLDEVLSMAACKAAIKAGQKLSFSEIEQLLNERQKVQNPSRCPHGRPTTIKFSLTDLEKQFKRT
jgi:DNA mismatch repair protein MutL